MGPTGDPAGPIEKKLLLGLALADHVVTSGDGADRFLGLALHVLDDALDAFCRTAVLVSHCYLPRWVFRYFERPPLELTFSGMRKSGRVKTSRKVSSLNG